MTDALPVGEVAPWQKKVAKPKVDTKKQVYKDMDFVFDKLPKDKDGAVSLDAFAESVGFHNKTLRRKIADHDTLSVKNGKILRQDSN